MEKGTDGCVGGRMTGTDSPTTVVEIGAIKGIP